MRRRGRRKGGRRKRLLNGQTYDWQHCHSGHHTLPQHHRGIPYIITSFDTSLHARPYVSRGGLTLVAQSGLRRIDVMNLIMPFSTSVIVSFVWDFQ